MAPVPRYDTIPTYLTPDQHQALMQVPADLPDREIARYSTFTEQERELINRRRRDSNRLGFAVQLALLRFPGRTLWRSKRSPDQDSPRWPINSGWLPQLYANKVLLSPVKGSILQPDFGHSRIFLYTQKRVDRTCRFGPLPFVVLV
ncbi:MAG: DUF4158 domain-containing protein [Ktedonobacteraceae bacterium]|jgi:hypothetical protein